MSSAAYLEVRVLNQDSAFDFCSGHVFLHIFLMLLNICNCHRLVLIESVVLV